ncbi:MAG: cytochrome c biogenesis CcdA family protein [Betaproteobacteria bacterium]
MNRKLAALAATGAVLVGTVLFFRFANVGTASLWRMSNEGTWLLPLVGASALLDSINPCAFSILLLTIAFLFTLGKLRTGILRIGAIYILGVFTAYTLIGLGLFQTLHLFDTPHFMAKLGAALLIALGLISVANALLPAFPVKLRIPPAAHPRMAALMENASLPAAFALGGLVGVCEFPCTGGPYLTVIGLLYDRATYATGLGYLLLYNLIFILPLVIMLFLASDRSLLTAVELWRKRNTRSMRLWGGNAMVALGIVILAL